MILQIKRPELQTGSIREDLTHFDKWSLEMEDDKKVVVSSSVGFNLRTCLYNETLTYGSSFSLHSHFSPPHLSLSSA
ncbi:hypothetical protein RJT34_24509 [Clitoria ternatea]|uniref:Uncharacterized protein n=1 Tax=Clitoria ternatea TaxID=43366 RepID=A0AAN9FQT1_CLITE